MYIMTNRYAIPVADLSDSEQFFNWLLMYLILALDQFFKQK